MRPSRPFAPIVWLGLATLVACGDDSTSPQPIDCVRGEPIEVGESMTGTLQTGDDLDIDGAYLDDYALTLDSDTDVQITMSSQEVDAFLWLLEGSGSLIESDNDGGDGSDSQITIDLDAGCYLVEATSSTPEQTGEYTLTIEEL